jgi:hypothetical protein
LGWHADRRAARRSHSERRHADYIVGRGGGSRGLYVVLDGREYAWSEVLQEVQALMQSHFSNIFLDGT